MDAPRLPAPCGTWPSPLTATVCARAALRLAQPRLTGERVYWIEGRAAEGGRCALVLREADGRLRDAVPAPFSVRSRAQEAGGGAYAVHGDDLWFVNDADQCLWHLRLGAAPRRLTPPDGARYADLQYDARRHALLAVREDLAADAHRPPAALVRIDCADGTVHTLVAGRDFLGAPRLSPDGARLAWLAWDAPLMPWDGTELWLAALDDAGMPHAARRVAGGRDESLCQPEWGPDGALYVMSDRSGWWNLQRVPGDGTDLVPVAPLAADCAFPAWQFGMSSWGFADRRTAVCAAARDGIWSLVAFDLARGTSRTLAVPCNTVEHLHVADGRLVALAGDAATPPGIVLHTFATGHTEVLRSATALELAPDMIATPRAVQFTGAGGDVLHGFYYPPRHARYTVPAEEKPPLILRCHGGPTAAASAALEPRVQYWTSRGFAWFDLNYRGSTGFGRAYRRALYGRWGEADVADCLDAARHLARTGLADPARLLVTGSSAGGFTALAALVGGGSLFAAGSIWYGIADLLTALRDTHKFEAHYGDVLIGPLPEAEALYRARSPLTHAERLMQPVLFFHGRDDRVVPPQQSECMHRALRAKGIMSECVVFDGEGHGFRRAETLAAVLAQELAFFRHVLGLKECPQREVSA